MIQGVLFPAAAVEPNPTVAEADKPRLCRQHREILNRLHKGPATNTELAAIGNRFGARIGELRKAGCVIARQHIGKSLWNYELLSFPSGLINLEGDAT